MDDLQARITADLGELAARCAYGRSDAEAAADVEVVFGWVSRLTAIAAVRVADLDGRGVVRSSGSVNASTWLRDRVHVTLATAHRVTALAAVLADRPALADAVAAGAVNTEQAVAIGRVLGELPTDTPPAVVDAATGVLVGHAARFEPAILRALGDRVLTHVDPDLADRVLQRRLAAEEHRATRERFLTLTPDGHGRTRLHGLLDLTAAATVQAAIGPLCAPANTLAGPDPRTAGARRADALTDVCALALRTTDLPAEGGSTAAVTVTIDYTTLAASTGAGTLDTGQPLSAAQVRRLACDARILPAVLDGHGVPIDVGQSRRLYTGAARHAVILRDRGCAFPGCDRPPKWCNIHHIRHWADGGPTNRDNGVALCGYHHQLIHRDTWTITLGPDRRPTFTPPTGLDPLQRPLRNPYHQRT